MSLTAKAIRIVLPLALLIAAPAWSQTPSSIDPALEAKAKGGDPAAMVDLAQAYDKAGRQADAIVLLKKAATMKAKYAVSTLVTIYFRKPGPPPKFGYLYALSPLCDSSALRGDEGMKYLAAESRAGNVDAMILLAENDRQGACGANPEDAADWFIKAAAAGSLQAKASLAEMYAAGKAVPRDLEKARSWRDAALQQADGKVARDNNLLSLLGPDGQVAYMGCGSSNINGNDWTSGCPAGIQ